MNSYQLRRLWGNVPILTTNLLESGLIDSKVNDALTAVAVSAFNNFSKANELEVNVPSSHGAARRKRRSRTSTRAHTIESPTIIIDPDTSSSKVTPNDNFFEHQRTRGYRLATPLISDCDAVSQLEEEHIVNAIAYYLRQFEDSRGMLSTTIADTLQSSGIGLSIDLWAAVQKGNGAYHHYHVHEGAIVSGVYYSCTPLGCAPLVFKKPECFVGNDEEDDVVIRPKEGQIVLFPPWLSHGVPKANTDQEDNSQSHLPRVSWAFNLNGKIALGDPWDVTRPIGNH